MIYYGAFSEGGGEVTARVTHDGMRRGVSVRFDKPSEPERRQAPRQITRPEPEAGDRARWRGGKQS